MYFKNRFKLKSNSGFLLLWGIPIYFLDVQKVRKDWWVGLIICMQTAIQIVDDAIHAIENSIIWCLYLIAYIVDTTSTEEEYSYSYDNLESLIDTWVEWCNTVKSFRSNWFMDFYDWSWGAVEFPYQMIFMKEELGIIPCFLQDAVEASSVHEMQKKIASLFD